MHIDDWLQLQTLSKHPFDSWDASSSREKSFHHYAVSPVLPSRVRTIETHPESTIFLAREGHGKTFMRRWFIDQYSASSLTSLIVLLDSNFWQRFEDHELRELNNGKPQFEVLRAIVKNVQHQRFADVSAPADTFEYLQWLFSKHRGKLLINEINDLQYILDQIKASETIINKDYSDIDVLSKLRLLSEISHMIGCKRFYVIVDEVEHTKKHRHTSLLKIFLRVANLHNYVYIKFFLSPETKSQLESENYRLDNLGNGGELIWNEELLKGLVSARLSECSNRTIKQLLQLCDPRIADPTSALINHSGCSPRELIKLLHRLFSFGAAYASEQQSFLNQKHVDLVLSEKPDPIKSRSSIQEISPDSEQEIQDLSNLLGTHRTTLAHLLDQEASFGKAYVPPSNIHGITNARDEIRQIKRELRRLGVPVEDRYGDEPTA